MTLELWHTINHNTGIIEISIECVGEFCAKLTFEFLINENQQKLEKLIKMINDNKKDDIIFSPPMGGNCFMVISQNSGTSLGFCLEGNCHTTNLTIELTQKNKSYFLKFFNNILANV